MKLLAIFPYNGNALEAIDCIGNLYRLVGFIDDQKEKQGIQKNGYEVFSREILLQYPSLYLLLVPGSPISFLLRQSIINSFSLPSEKFATIIHPRTSISPSAKIGYNVLIMAGVVITSNAVIGNHVCILPNTVIHHDVEIGEFSIIGSNVTIAGHTTIGKNCYISSASSITNGINIGDRVMVGIGTNVIKNINSNTTVAGNPARTISKIPNLNTT